MTASAFEKQRTRTGPFDRLDEPFVISGPKIRRFGDRWYLWYIAGTKWIADERPARARVSHPHGDVGRRHHLDTAHRELIPRGSRRTSARRART